MDASSTAGTKRPYAHPLLWIPTSYFAMAMGYVTITTTSNIMFRDLGYSVAQAAAWSSDLGIFYMLKPFWAPLLEMFKTKKFFVIITQFLLAAGFMVVATLLTVPNSTMMMLAVMWVIGFVGATQDIASDGVYVTTLPAKEQSAFTGVQSMSWSIGPIVSTGIMVSASGYFHDEMGMDYATSWRLVMMAIAGLLAVSAVYHMKMLPPGAKAADAPTNVGQAVASFADQFKTFFQKKGIWSMLAFAFLYRTSQGFLDKVGPLFMKDALEAGGLGLGNMVLGNINGTVGTVGFVAGSILGGLFTSKKGLKHALIWLCLAINIPNATYLYLGYFQPQNVYLIGGIITMEKFWFGFGAVGHMLYMMQQLAPGKYKTAHYAFGTGLLALCMWSTGRVSGFIQEEIGYNSYFWFVMIATIPSFIISWLAPFNVKHDDADGEAGTASESAA